MCVRWWSRRWCRCLNFLLHQLQANRGPTPHSRRKWRMRLHLWEYRRPHRWHGNGGPFPVPPDRSSVISFEWCLFDIMFLTADTARTPGRSRGFTPVISLILLPIKQNIQVSYNKEYILQIMRHTSIYLSCHRKYNTNLKLTTL
jgi:hypothetical protein